MKLQNKLLATIFTMLLTLPTASNASSAVDCLAKTIYFEARNQPTRGQEAVGHIVNNRVRSSLYPNSICRVVRQPDQFSPHIRRGTYPSNRTAYNKAKEIARSILNGTSRDMTKGALYFHGRRANPYWSRGFTRVYSDRAHHFYKP